MLTGASVGPDRVDAGLCPDCRHSRTVQTRRGSLFVLCERSRTDPAFPRYPALPVRQCRGYERAADGAGGRA
jgi:hypothetical protein